MKDAFIFYTNCICLNMQKFKISLVCRFFILMATASGALNAAGQQVQVAAGDVYGLDPLLYNGLAYYFNPPSKTQGTQYLFDNFDTDGTITVRGVKFTHQTLNYDVYNQHLILKYKTNIGSVKLLQVSFAWLSSFDLYNRHFEVITTADTLKEIFQSIGQGPLKVLYAYSKKINVGNLAQTSELYFTKELRFKYVYDGTKRSKYKNNRSFVSAFATAYRDSIWKYIRKHKLAVQKANDLQMNDLINYCNSLIGT